MATVTFYHDESIKSYTISYERDSGTSTTRTIDSEDEGESVNLADGETFTITKVNVSNTTFFSNKNFYVEITYTNNEYDTYSDCDAGDSFGSNPNETIAEVWVYQESKEFDVTLKTGTGIKSFIANGTTVTSQKKFEGLTYWNSLTVTDFKYTSTVYGAPITGTNVTNLGDLENNAYGEAVEWYWDGGGGTVTFKATDYTVTTPTLSLTRDGYKKIAYEIEFKDDQSATYLLNNQAVLQILDGASIVYESENIYTNLTGTLDFSNIKIFQKYTGKATFTHEVIEKTYEATDIIYLLPLLSMNWGDEEGVLSTATSAKVIILADADMGNENPTAIVRIYNTQNKLIATKEEEIGSLNDNIEIPFDNLTHNTTYTAKITYQINGSTVGSDEISFTTLNAYTINVKLNNLNHIYVETEDMEDVYISNGGTFLVIPGETFTVSFPKNKTGTSAFTAYPQTHDEGKKATYSWPYGFPVKAEGIKNKETSRIPDDPGKASYLVGTAETENGKTYTFTAYPSGWTGWTDTEKPKAGQQTTTFSVESWNKLVNCLDAWNAFCGQSAVSGTFMPQNDSYNFTATIYNKIYDELTNLFAISEDAPIMPRVEIGKERQTEVSASRLINIGNNIKYANLGKDYQ